jgi:ppGpp synthetase/RelA/SpoT-type nucleotidyltranferase
MDDPVAIANNAAGWATLSDQDWVALHVPRFTGVRPRYVTYEAFLCAVLRHACDNLAPDAIVSTRAKTIASFAEKILRKRQSYTNPKDPRPPDPLLRMTDLCGGRVITQTADQVREICQFIEDAFDVDWSHSEDTGLRLHAREFGYRSIHYIVRVDRAKLRAAGIAIEPPADVLAPAALAAEVQVRTLLEHAWAHFAHDHTYKTEMSVPGRIDRRFAALAAVLEGADREFGWLVQELNEYKSNFGAHHTAEEVEREIAQLRIVLAHTPGNVAQAVKLAHLALNAGRHATALEILGPYRMENHQGVQRALGLALCEPHWEGPKSAEYREGREFLRKACEHPKADAETVCALAETWSRTDKTRARDLFGRAAAIDPTEPLTLCRYVEFEIDRHSTSAIVSLVAPLIRSAMDRCRRQIEARVNLPLAWSCLGVFHLLLQQPLEALHAIAQVVRLCEARTDAQAPLGAAARVLQRTRDTLGHVESIRDQLPGFEWVHRLVLLGLAVRVGDDDAADALKARASWGSGAPYLGPADRVVIISGGCVPRVQAFMGTLRPDLLAASDGLSFTLLSGGTTVGVAGLAGDMAEASGGRIRAIGYLPRSLPLHVQQDGNRARYERLVPSTGTDFTPLEPLQGWTDLVTAGIDPGRVKLLGYAGADISRAEHAVALALGARVGVIDDPLLPKERRFDDPAWSDHPNLVRLPRDRMTLRAFLLVDELPARREELTAAAKGAHEDYVKGATPKEPSLLPWDKLSDDLKLANYHQVAYAEHILRTAGLGVRPRPATDGPLLDMAAEIGEDGIARLAEMEHGRWNVERLLRGWRYAELKDVVRHLSPYLVPWGALPRSIQQFDLDVIRGLPARFREAGLEVYRLEGAAEGHA